MGRVICAALATLLATSPCGAFHLEDSLRGSTRGNLVGGVIMADGWHVTDRRDRIWYALPRLTSGSVEFTVTNLTMASLGDTADSEIFAMYEAGYGIAEPISYSDFRENHYKCMLRLYANGETARAGYQKLMWGMCPSGAPGRGTCGCGSFFEEPFAGPGGWDGSPQQLRVEWGGGTTRYLRNGRVVVTIDWSRSGLAFGPSDLHMSLGTSRPSAVGDAQLPVGVVFSNLVVDGTEGPLATCPGAVIPDAGPPPDAAPPVMSGDTLEVPAVEDVTVAPGAPTTVYPDVRDLSVGVGDSEFYVKFRVPAVRGRVVRAQLVLQSADFSSARGTGASVYRAGNASWSETSLTWSARPGTAGARLGRIDGVTVDAPYVVELPAGAVTGEGTYAFAVTSESGDADSAHFDSKEVTSARGPRLRLTLDPTMPPPPDASVAPDAVVAFDAPQADAAPPSDLASPSDRTVPNDLAAAEDVAGSADATPMRPEVGPDEGAYALPPDDGCGCRATMRGGGGRGLTLLAAMGLGLRRRRARRRHT